MSYVSRLRIPVHAALVGWVALLLSCATTPPEPAAPPDWEIFETGFDESFRGLSVAPDGSVWASGTHGTVIRSTDDGASWERLPIPEAAELDLRDIEAFSRDEAVAISAGHPARIFVTTDGGASWALTHEDLREGIFFDAMAFWDRRHGIAFGDPIDGRFVVITTEDGGRSWQAVAPDALPPALDGEAGFAASGSCLTVSGDRHVWFGTGGTHARVFRSSDRGESWAVSETPVTHGESSTGIFSIAFVDENHGVVVGGNYELPEVATDNIALTTDGGITWRAPGLGPAGFRSAVRYLDREGRLLVAVGSDGAGLSVDGGQSWSALGNRGFHALGAAGAEDNPQNAWAIGADGIAGRLRLTPPPP